jgi:hypothetical protein
MNIIFYAKACIGTGMYHFAFVALKKSLIHNPEDIRIVLMLGKVLKLMGRSADAKKQFEHAKQLVDDVLFMPKEVLLNDIASWEDEKGISLAKLQNKGGL